MNEVVEEAPHEAPPEMTACLPAGVTIQSYQKVSDGWHEGYLLTLSGPLRAGQAPQAILRIWRSQLSYHRLEVSTGAAVELAAIALASEAGVPTAGCTLPAGGATFAGACARAPRGEACDWAVYDYVAHADERVAQRAVEAAAGTTSTFLLQTMAKLHSLNLAQRDTSPLPRFEDWREHTAYLITLAQQTGYEDAIRAAESVRGLLEAHAPPELPPALLHLDWHFGNVLCDATGQAKALVDWEFAGVGDPRIDLARFCRRERWSGDKVCRDRGSDERTQELWQTYATARFGPGAPALVHLGPPEPWLALESVLVLVIGAGACARVRDQQQGGNTVAAPLVRCGLEEWIEARWWRLWIQCVSWPVEHAVWAHCLVGST